MNESTALMHSHACYVLNCVWQLNNNILYKNLLSLEWLEPDKVTGIVKRYKTIPIRQNWGRVILP